ncbi:phosphoenolpyruvate hydrolase family protein [Brenneria alni]|uniref:phosphoenolpyruvate hydrolase family protein n=1 Tax=Brenneria alni TaxID=71656 RepID=UPI0011C49184|nr:phosphoenolpyruvate hydrolase family protein [Brenneria alni]
MGGNASQIPTRPTSSLPEQETDIGNRRKATTPYVFSTEDVVAMTKTGADNSGV